MSVRLTTFFVALGVWIAASILFCRPVSGAIVDPMPSQVKDILRHATLQKLQACLQQKAGLRAAQVKKLKGALARGSLKLSQVRMTGFGVGQFCGEHFLQTPARKAWFRQVSLSIKGYFSCLAKRKLVCTFRKHSIQCWKLGIELLFQSFSDGTPFQSKMPRPFVCTSPAFTFHGKVPAASLGVCAYAKKIASWKGDEQHLLGLLRGCTLEQLFRRYWKGAFRFRQVVVIEKRVGEAYRGGRILISLKFTKLPLLQLRHPLGMKGVPLASFLRPLDIHGMRLVVPKAAAAAPGNRCKRACCP